MRVEWRSVAWPGPFSMCELCMTSPRPCSKTEVAPYVNVKTEVSIARRGTHSTCTPPWLLSQFIPSGKWCVQSHAKTRTCRRYRYRYRSSIKMPNGPLRRMQFGQQEITRFARTMRDTADSLVHESRWCISW